MKCEEKEVEPVLYAYRLYFQEFRQERMQPFYEAFVELDELTNRVPDHPRVQALTKQRTAMTKSLKQLFEKHQWSFMFDTTQPIPTWVEQTTGPPLVSFDQWISKDIDTLQREDDLKKRTAVS
jgi:hypothetical protein